VNPGTRKELRRTRRSTSIISLDRIPSLDVVEAAVVVDAAAPVDAAEVEAVGTKADEARVVTLARSGEGPVRIQRFAGITGSHMHIANGASGLIMGTRVDGILLITPNGTMLL